TVPGGKRADTNTSASDIVTDVAFSPSGSQIATVSADRYLRVWDRAGRVLFAAQAHAAKPSSVAWSPDGSMIATADPNVLVIWNAVAGRVLRQIQYVPLTDTSIDENAVLGWSPNSTWIGAGTSRYVHVINALTGVRFGTLWATNSQVNAVRFDRLGTRIATALGDGTVAAFLTNATNIQTYPPATRAFTDFTLTGGHSQAVLDISWSSDDSRIVSGGRDNNVVLWDVGTRTIITSSGVSGGWVTGVEWRKDGFGFVTVSAGLAPVTPPRLIYWTNAGAPALTIPLGGALNGVDASAVGEIGTASSDLSARLYSLGGSLNRILVAHKPDAAIVVDGWSRYSDRDGSFTHGLDIATFYRWNATAGRWDGTGLFAPSVNGTQASFQFGERLFNELSLPRSLLGDPAGISMELFSASRAATKPQDTAPTDPNVNFKNLDFGPGSFSLGGFAYLQPGRYTVSPAIVSLSGTFHFGYHPSPILTRLFGAVGLLVVDPSVAGRYDEVYVDLNTDRRFDLADVRVDVGQPVASLDSLDAAGAPGRDGLADISGGLLYFIADGVTPIPYSNRYVQLQLATNPNLVNRIPEAGDLVAFLGEFRLDALTGAKSEHGTRLASAIVGRGLLTPAAIGVAPAAKLVGLANALDDVISSWYFAVEGYDGIPGTGDEAQVVLSPFVFPTLPNDGSDTFSRTADYLSEVHSGGRATFVAPAGDNGFGYGSIASPASGPAVLAIGRTEDGTATSSLEGGQEGPNAHFLDPALPSARGPTAIGGPKPDLLAIGTAITDLPLQSASGGGITAVATTPMTGTDVAAAIAAGAVALVRQAAGSGVSADRIAQFLRSGALDLSYDALVQGSGFLDVAESVRLARGGGGVLASPATLVAGTYRGARADAYPRTLAPGGSDSLTLRPENRG
ncbi:MAG TPA: S8 family serine peptidase, partial [Thermoplasmata archaeon]|nr:S8 family serine peptidase [Thermoplasmata archaeon]